MHRHRVKRRVPRGAIQLVAAALFNGYAAGFVRGGMYQGPLKRACVPVLNCWSCPGALGACPIGALQAALGAPGRRRFPFYVLGTLMLFGVVLGRLACGLLCPFGFVQDLLYKIPVKKWRPPRRIDRPLRYLKYAVLAALVALPLLLKPAFGGAPPYFCKYLCPAGTLEAGIPQLLLNPSLRGLAGMLFRSCSSRSSRWPRRWAAPSAATCARWARCTGCSTGSACPGWRWTSTSACTAAPASGPARCRWT